MLQNDKEKWGDSECKLRKYNHCFVGILYDNVFARVMFINSFVTQQVKVLRFFSVVSKIEAQRYPFGAIAEIVYCPMWMILDMYVQYTWMLFEWTRTTADIQCIVSNNTFIDKFV